MNERLLDLIRGVRRRWRLRIALGAAAILAAFTLLAVLAATWGMDYFRFTPAAVSGFRLAAWIAVILVATLALTRVLRRRASDAQVALYLEEHEPALEGRLLAAVQFARAADPAVSRPLVDRVVADAVSRCESRPAWRQIERRGIATASAVLGAVVLASALLWLTRPGFVISGAPFLVPFATSGEKPYLIGVEPGDTTIARGADLGISAQLRGFTAGEVALLTRRGGNGAWERVAMALDDGEGLHTALLLAIRDDLEYMIEAAGVRSPLFKVRVADTPWVQDISVSYQFPVYSGLQREEQQGGDIAALIGTVATVTIKPTVAVSSGILVALGRDTVHLTADSAGRLQGAITVRESGEYRLFFPGPDGRLGAGSPVYGIEALRDQPPVVRISKPGRDADATSVDEVFLEAHATDDIAVRRLELAWRVNGGAERVVPLFGPGARRDVIAGHTLFLEEMALRPGDVISYYARAADGRSDSSAALSDIYFLTIRPFDRAFREAEQNGMPGGQQSVDAGELSERQREIVAGTFRVLRDRTAATEARFREDVATLTLAQGRLREEVGTLLERLRTRGVTASDTAMAKVALALDSAVAAMRLAERELGRRAADSALTPEQLALTHLQRAEAVFDRERQVARGNQQGGGGGSSRRANELADLFELELDRMRNQYESVERERQNDNTAQLDETLERVRELARRQQQENERRRAQAQGGNEGQRRMADEADSLARRLERLSRERQDQELDDAAQQLREAAQQMRRSGSSQGASGNAALDRLREAQRNLEGGRTSALRQGIQQAQGRTRRLEQQSDENARDLGNLDTGDPATRGDRVRQMMDRTNRMAQEAGALDDELERLAREAGQGQPQAAQRLRDAARAMRDGRLEEKLRYSRMLVQGNNLEPARTFAEQIGVDIDSLANRLRAAAEAVGESREDRVSRGLERMRDIANSMERMAERQGETGQRGERSETGEQQGQQEGQQGQRGSAQQQGQQGQQQGQRGDQPGRQLQREYANQTRELRDIREQLRRDGVNVEDLDDVLMGMGRADNMGIGTPRGMQQLSQVIVPGLREFEFTVRRDIGGAPRAPRVGAEAQAPEAYRKAVADYYRALATPRN